MRHSWELASVASCRESFFMLIFVSLDLRKRTPDVRIIDAAIRGLLHSTSQHTNLKQKTISPYVYI